MRLARLYRDALGDPTRAAATYERFVSEYPHSLLLDDALYEEGALLLDHGEHARGCALLARAIETHGGHAARLARERAARDCDQDGGGPT
jgi:TolA-binding protein